MQAKQTRLDTVFQRTDQATLERIASEALRSVLRGVTATEVAVAARAIREAITADQDATQAILEAVARGEVPF